MPAIQYQSPINMAICPQWIPAFERFAQAKNDGSFRPFVLKSSERAVPEDKDAPIVTIKILLVSTTVHPVIRRRDEDLLQRPQFLNMFGMNPKLINQIATDNREQDFSWKAGSEEREIENKTVKVCAGLTEGGAKIEVFALMVRDMSSPEQRHFVSPSMLPVIRQIVKHKTRQPGAKALF